VWLDYHLRHFGVVALVLLFPTLGIPFLLFINPDGVEPMALIAILVGGTASFAMYIALLLLTIRAYRDPIWARMDDEVNGDEASRDRIDG
jgi:hypothetical protein